MTASRGEQVEPQNSRLAAEDSVTRDFAAYCADVKADIEARRLAPAEWLIWNASGTPREQTELIAAVMLNQGLEPDELRESVRDEAENSEHLQLLPMAMEWVRDNRPEYVAAIGRIIKRLEADWPQVGEGICKLTEERNQQRD